MTRYYICDTEEDYSDRNIWFIASDEPVDVVKKVLALCSFPATAIFDAPPSYWEGEWASLEALVRSALYDDLSGLGIMEHRSYQEKLDGKPPALHAKISEVPLFVLRLALAKACEKRDIALSLQTGPPSPPKNWGWDRIFGDYVQMTRLLEAEVSSREKGEQPSAS